MEIKHTCILDSCNTQKKYLNFYESNLPNKFNIDLCEIFYDQEVTRVRHEIDFSLSREEAFNLYEELREFLFGEK